MVFFKDDQNTERSISFKCKIGKRSQICPSTCPLYIGREYGGVVDACAVKSKENKNGLDIQHGEVITITVGGE